MSRRIVQVHHLIRCLFSSTPSCGPVTNLLLVYTLLAVFAMPFRTRGEGGDAARIWSTADGEDLTGVLEEVHERVVVIRQPDGARAVLSRHRLSKDDQLFLARLDGEEPQREKLADLLLPSDLAAEYRRLQTRLAHLGGLLEARRLSSEQHLQERGNVLQAFEKKVLDHTGDDDGKTAEIMSGLGLEN